MSDLYKEHLVKKEPQAKDRLLKFGSIAVIVVVAALGLLISPLFLAAAVILGVLAYYFVFPETDLEYEYLLVNSSLDIDKVLAKSRRKRVASYDLKQADLIAPTDSARMDYYRSNSSLKTVDYSSGNESHRRFAIIINADGAAQRVLIEPDEEMEKAMQSALPGKVFLS